MLFAVATAIPQGELCYSLQYFICYIFVNISLHKPVQMALWFTGLQAVKLLQVFPSVALENRSVVPIHL